MYVNDWHGLVFWKAANPAMGGMDWYVFGGKETGCTYVGDQGNFFNQWQPRLLNPYVAEKVNVFQCPSDDSAAAWADGTSSSFDWVGNSYHFNSDGYPGNAVALGDMSGITYSADPNAGLAGVKMSHVKDSSNTVLFFDAALPYQVSWHPQGKGNVCFADGHVVFREFPTPINVLWK